MEQQKLESLLIDYIDGKLNSVDKHYVEQELLKNPKSYKLYEELKEVIQLLNRRTSLEPSKMLKNNFEEMIEQEIKASEKSKVIRLNPVWYRVAAAIAFLIVGVSVGFWVSNYNRRQADLAKAEIEKANTQRMVSMIKNENSAGQRILGLKAASEDEKINVQLLKVLIHTLNEDPNVNVRMAALEGLRKFYQEPLVRKALIGSLAVQKDPVIQIYLIQILVEMKDKAAVQPLKQIIENEELIPAVKDEANMGILVLS